jgi:F0F1-type ATP synthase assembly protein I
MNLKENIGDFLRINELKDNVTTLVESKIELVKIDFQEKIEIVVVKVIYAAVLAFLGFVVAIFLSILIAVFLNHFLESDYLGFLIVGLFYGIILAIWIFAKNTVSEKIKIVAEKITDSQIENRLN